MSKNKKKCFVISQIGEEDSDIRKRSDQIFTYVIEKAVTTFGYSAIRADKIPRPGIITSQIIEHLLKDELVIADLTGKNPNVYYELAVRHAVKKPFIQIKEVLENIPFDITNMRTINVDYRYIDSMDKCRDEIVKQIKEIEDNPDKIIETPICFSLDSLQLKNSTDPQSKLLMSLVSEMQTIGSEVDMLSKRNSSEKIITNDFRPSIDDTAKDEKTVISTVMREICNRHMNAERDGHSVEFNIDEIIHTYLGAFSREYAFQFILKFEIEHGYIKLLPQDRVRLTDAGKEYCNSV
jgi:hypothetical protein